MGAVLYGDLFVAGNSFVNIIIFIFVGRFLNKKINMCRYVIVSISISIIYLLVIYKNFILSSIISQLLIILAGILLYRPKNIWEMIIIYLIIGLFSFFSATLINAISYYTGLENGNIVIPIGILLANKIITFSTQYLHKTRDYYDIEISCNGKSILLRGLLDTGHSLTEPISKKPVLIAEYKYIKEILPNIFNSIYKNQDIEDIYFFVDKLSDTNFSNKIKIIPYSSLGKNRDILIGFETDKIVIGKKSIEKPIIGIYNSVLCKDGRYNALISPKHLGR